VTSPRRFRRGGRGAAEDGSVPIEFALGIGLLLLPVAVGVLTFPTWVERQSLARLAAQEAARTVVLAADPAAGYQAGTALAQRIAANHGAPDAITAVTYDGAPIRRGSITATVTVAIPLPGLPPFDLLPALAWTTSHTEPIDPYRSLP